MVEKYHRTIRGCSLLFLLAAFACNPYLIRSVILKTNLRGEIVLLIKIFEVLAFILSASLFLISFKGEKNLLGRCFKNLTISFATLFFLFFGFAGTEAGLRIYVNRIGLNIHPNDKIVRETIFSNNKTFFQSRQKPDKTFHSRYVNTNEHGFRSPPFEKKEDNSIRIAALGGSTMWGYNVSDDHTIADFLGERFREGQKNAEVFNLGLNSSTFSQQTKYLYEYFNKIQPDIIIVYCGVNEFIEGAGSSTETLLQRFLNKLDGYHVFKLMFAWAGSKQEKSALTVETKLEMDKAVHSFKEEQKTFEEFCSKKGLLCFIFFQPLIYHKNQKTFYEKMVAGARRHKSSNDLFYDYFVDQSLRNASGKKPSAGMTDIRNVFLNNEEHLFIDSVHVNYIGNQLIAKRIYDEIQKDIPIP